MNNIFGIRDQDYYYSIMIIEEINFKIIITITDKWKVSGASKACYYGRGGAVFGVGRCWRCSQETHGTSLYHYISVPHIMSILS